MHIGDAVINEYKVAGLHESPPALLIEALKEILCVDAEEHVLIFEPCSTPDVLLASTPPP